MDDGRIVLRIDALTTTIREELTWLIELPLPTYAALGSLCGLSADCLRDKVLRASQVAVAFLNFRCLQHVDTMPFKLAKGDDEQLMDNLVGLRGAPAPKEHVAHQLWQLDLVLLCRSVPAVIYDIWSAHFCLYMCVHVYIHVYVYIYMCAYGLVYAYAYICTCLCLYTRMLLYICVYMHAYLCSCVSVIICIRIHITNVCCEYT